MPILLGSPGVHGEPIDSKTVRTMVGAYRAVTQNSPGAIKHVHYSVYEMLRLFQANEIINEEILGSIVANSPGILDGMFGVKIYLGTHIELSQCPPKPPLNSPDARYIYRDTCIICNTMLDTKKGGVWVDMLTDEKNSISMSAYDALEKGSVSPPETNTTIDGTPMESIGDV